MIYSKNNRLDEWFEIVDILYSHKALRWMLTNRGGWKICHGFFQDQMRISGGTILSTSRFQNNRYSVKYYVSLIFSDELNNLLAEYDIFFVHSPTVSNVAVARNYFWTGTSL